MLCIGLNAWLAQFQQRSLTHTVMNMVPVQSVLCAEPFYCYHCDPLTPSCPIVSTPAVPGNLADTRTLQGYRAANPSLRNQPQSPEPNYSSAGMAQVNQSHGEESGSHSSHGISELSLQSWKMLPSASTEGEEEACTEKAFERLTFNRELDWSQGDKFFWIKSDIWATSRYLSGLPTALTGAEPKMLGISSDDPPHPSTGHEFFTFTSLQDNRTSVVQIQCTPTIRSWWSSPAAISHNHH